MGEPGWAGAIPPAVAAAMRGNAWRYTLAWVLAMLPVMAANALLDLAVKASGVDVRSIPVALGKSVFRQALLFLHFSLGASVGAFTYAALLGGRTQASGTRPLH